MSALAFCLRRSTTLSVITASPPCSPSDETLNQSRKPRETLSGSHVVSSIFSPNDFVLALRARIEAIPDGTAGGPKSTSAWAPSTTSRPDIKFDSDGRFDDDYFQESHESSQFRQEFEMRKIKQAVKTHHVCARFLFETIDDSVGHHGVSTVFSVRRNPKPITEAERDSVGKSRRLLHLLSVRNWAFFCFALIQLAARNDFVLALRARIEAIPDGTAGGPKSTSAWAPSTTSRPDIKFDSDGRFDDDYFQESHESSQFRQEFEMRKIKQAGLDALKNMASDMNEVSFLNYISYNRLPTYSVFELMNHLI
ncbi:hypothetical protein F2Q69_00007350 [Brassica cretica]|uniref:Uncharacterized protein n=1 Tax=Brassica cretica TaxID=69181 RepID=A0A8S9PHI5_BRACR|nr:hypothetical protein F2Q69_00007350 [Brassica cretica]